METYISLLRGINVSGQKKIQMTDLKVLFESIHFNNVITYIQSGNVIFDTNKKATNHELVKNIENAITEKYHFDVPVIIRTLKELMNIISSNLFLNESKLDMEKFHVTFLNDDPKPTDLNIIKSLDFSPDRFIVIKNVVYLYCPNGYGITKLSNTFFENKLKVKATTRNWKTVNKLLALAQEKE